MELSYINQEEQYLMMVCSPNVISVIADSLNPGGTSGAIKTSGEGQHGTVKAPATASA